MDTQPHNRTLTTPLDRATQDAAGLLATVLGLELSDRNPDLQARLQESLADGGLHSTVRIPLDTHRPQRRESGAVADQRGRASVGARLAADPVVAVLGSGGVQDFGGRT